jgi:hypothetical protein
MAASTASNTVMKSLRLRNGAVGEGLSVSHSYEKLDQDGPHELMHPPDCKQEAP